MTKPELTIQKQVAAAAFIIAIMKSDAVIKATINSKTVEKVNGNDSLFQAYIRVRPPISSCPKPFTSKTSDMK